MNVYIYHATRYGSLIKQNGFDTKHSYKNRNEQLGAGEAIYFTHDKSVAMDYTMAASNESFLPIVIEELEKKDEIAGFLLRNSVELGRKKAWELLFEKYGDNISTEYNNKEYDLNDVYDISLYIRGSKTLEEDSQDNSNFLSGGHNAYLPEMIINDAKLMGITTIPEDPEILKYKLSKKAKIKDIGYTDISNEEALKAKEEGYQGITFKNQYSIDNQIEMAIFDVSIIENVVLIEERITSDNISLEILEETMELISELRFVDFDTILQKMLEEKMFNINILSEFEIHKSLKNLLSTIYKLGLIDIVQDNKIHLKIDLKAEPLYTYISKIKSDNPILKELILKFREVEVKHNTIKKSTTFTP